MLRQPPIWQAGYMHADRFGITNKKLAKGVGSIHASKGCAPAESTISTWLFLKGKSKQTVHTSTKRTNTPISALATADRFVGKRSGECMHTVVHAAEVENRPLIHGRRTTFVERFDKTRPVSHQIRYVLFARPQTLAMQRLSVGTRSRAFDQEHAVGKRADSIKYRGVFLRECSAAPHKRPRSEIVS